MGTKWLLNLDRNQCVVDVVSVRDVDVVQHKFIFGKRSNSGPIRPVFLNFPQFSTIFLTFPSCLLLAIEFLVFWSFVLWFCGHVTWLFYCHSLQSLLFYLFRPQLSIHPHHSTIFTNFSTMDQIFLADFSTNIEYILAFGSFHFENVFLFMAKIWFTEIF